MDVKDRVVLTEDDMRMVEDFFAHYNDPKLNNLVMTTALKRELDKFRDKKNSYSVEDQKAFTIALCGALAKTTHPLLRDEAIKDVLAACENVHTDAQFYEEFEKTIQDPQEEG